MINICFKHIPTILFVIITVINRSKYNRHRHTIQISWISICTDTVIEYHCADVPSCLASHSPLFGGSCYFHLVSGKNSIYLWQCIQIKSYNIPIKILSAWTKI